jgi:hypothetical protein
VLVLPLSIAGVGVMTPWRALAAAQAWTDHRRASPSAVGHALEEQWRSDHSAGTDRPANIA